MMKRINLSRVLLGLLLIGGCSDKDDTLAKYISDQVEITDSEIVLPASGRSSESTIITSDHPWTLEGTSDWCTYSPQSGPAGTSTVYFTLSPNEGYDDRSMNVTLASAGKSMVLTVYQKKKDAIILSKDKFDNIGQEGGTIDVEMETNVVCTVQIPNDGEWITQIASRAATSRGLERKVSSFQIAPNPDGEMRKGEIIFIGEDGKLRDTVTVIQAQRDMIMFVQETVKVPLEGQQLNVDLRTNIDYEVLISAGWVKLVQSRSMRTDRLVLTILESDVERDTDVVIRDKNNPALSATLTIYQVEKETIIFQADTLRVDRAEGVYQQIVGDNIGGKYELFIPSYATWVSTVETTRSRALDYNPISVKIEENPEGMPSRMAKVYLKATENDTLYSQPLVIIQEGRALMNSAEEVLHAIALELGYTTWSTAVQNSWKPGTGTGVGTFTGCGRTNGVFTRVSFPSAAKGTLPELFADLVTVEELTIGASSGNIIGDIPKTIGSMPKLRKLTINGVFNSIPEELAQLETLEDLTINCNFQNREQLAETMAVIGRFSNLKRLSLSNQDYGTEFPDSWAELKKVEEFSLSSVKSIEHLDCLKGMESLKNLTLSTIPTLRGDALDVIEHIYNLERLNITSTSITTIPPAIKNHTNLNYLSLVRNMIQSIPEEIGYLTKLTTFTLNGDATKGEEYMAKGVIPESIINLTQLTSLNLSNNLLEGKIPPMGALVNLKTLNFKGNNLEGLPEDIGGMRSLTSVDISNNPLTGEIPKSIGELVNVTTLNFSRDTVLYKGDDKGLFGFIPDEIGNMENLTTLNLTNNQLLGNIPKTIGNLKKLSNIFLAYNNLTGDIPVELCNTGNTGFIYIQLQHNNLNGTIPNQLSQLKLQVLNLGGNNLRGEVPEGVMGASGSFNGSSAQLHLNGNRLTGVIPNRLKDALTINRSTPWRIFDQQEGFGLTSN